MGILINNEQLIERLLLRINEFSVEDKIDITQSFLFSLYKISTQPIKDKIKEFALGIDTTINDGEKKHMKLIFELVLVAHGFKKLPENIIPELSAYIEPYKSGTAFSTVLYSLKHQLEYLIKEKSIETLVPILSDIDDSIARHKKRDKFFFI